MEPSPEDVILEEEIDPSYEPTKEELVEYATWLGMDLTNHKNLLWIAKEALIAPLPKDWKPCLTEEDEIYYFNFTTGRSIWDHPCDEYYRQVYKEEVEKLNKLLQGDQKVSGSSPSPRDEGKLVQSSTKSSQKSSAGDSSCGSSLERGSARDLTVSSKPSFPRGLLSSSNDNHLSRSLPLPCLVGHPALLNLKGGSYDSMIRLYGASPANNEGSIRLANFLKMQGSLQVKKNDTSTSCLSTASLEEHFSGNMNEEKRRQGDDKRRAFEKKITQIKDRIEKKLVDEERVVLQQERVEMLERVCKQVQEESSHVLDSLRRQIMERMEQNIREETQALLAKRRKEIVDEVETEIHAERHLLVEKRKSEESRSLGSDVGVMGSRVCVKAKEAETSNLDNAGIITSNMLLTPKDTGDSCTQQRKQDEAESLKTQKGNGEIPKKSNVHGEPNCSRNLQTPVRISSRLLTDQDKGEEKTMEESSQKLEAEERKFEKSFHVQDLSTSLMLKLEVFLKIGTTND